MSVRKQNVVSKVDGKQLIWVFLSGRSFHPHLPSMQVKRTLNELIIWKMNLLVVPITSVEFKSAFLHAQWQAIFYENGLNFSEDIHIKFRETELIEMS